MGSCAFFKKSLHEYFTSRKATKRSGGGHGMIYFDAVIIKELS